MASNHGNQCGPHSYWLLVGGAIPMLCQAEAVSREREAREARARPMNAGNEMIFNTSIDMIILNHYVEIILIMILIFN